MQYLFVMGLCQIPLSAAEPGQTSPNQLYLDRRVFRLKLLQIQHYSITTAISQYGPQLLCSAANQIIKPPSRPRQQRFTSDNHAMSDKNIIFSNPIPGGRTFYTSLKSTTPNYLSYHLYYSFGLRSVNGIL